MKKVEYAEGEYYHVYNRGVDKRKTFMDNEDHYRFLHDLYELNDKNNTPAFCRRSELVGSEAPYNEKRELLVEIVCFCLMPNHFHLILKQLTEKGISTFMHKLGTGYTNFFNKKYERSGALFQGPFKAVHVKTDEQMMQLGRYVHLNPVDIFHPGRKEEGIKNLKEAASFLKSYRWSSYSDYIGIKNYPSLINKEFMMKSYFADEKDYEKFVISGLNGDQKEINNLIIED
jgi:putative transposase